MNEQIDSPTVRLIDQEGSQIGIVSSREALDMAEKAGFDLVEVAPNSKPPVCRIMNFGKYKYEISKKVKQTRKNRHTTQVKEIKMRSKISDHDFDFKMNHAVEFFKHGDKVKFTVVLRGREILHADFGEALISRIVEALKDAATVETSKRREGNNFTVTMISK